MKIDMEFDCTQREFVEDISNIVYMRMHGVKRQEPGYFFRKEPLDDPRERQSLMIAEEIFELITGDSPDYSDDAD
jgi:hypothetical protein